MGFTARRRIGLGSLGVLGTRAVPEPQDLLSAALAQFHLPGAKLLSVGLPQMLPNRLAGGAQAMSKREAISWNPQRSGLECTVIIRHLGLWIHP